MEQAQATVPGGNRVSGVVQSGGRCIGCARGRAAAYPITEVRLAIQRFARGEPFFARPPVPRLHMAKLPLDAPERVHDPRADRWPLVFCNHLARPLCQQPTPAVSHHRATPRLDLHPFVGQSWVWERTGQTVGTLRRRRG